MKIVKQILSLITSIFLKFLNGEERTYTTGNYRFLPTSQAMQTLEESVTIIPRN